LTPAAISLTGIFNPLIAGVGTHIITYIWTSSNNCPDTATRNVKVLAPPVVNTFTTLGNRCENNSIIFQNTVTQGDGTINTWVYDWGDGTPNTTATNGNDVTHTYLLPNTYTATLYVITNGLCRSAPPLPLQVIVNPLPRPDFTFTDTTCLPQATVTFKNITPNIGNWAYNWNLDFPSTLPADQSTQVTNVPYTYTTLTPAHSVRLTATSGTTGCTLSITKPITGIHPAPTASFNFNKPSVCLAQNVTVLDNSTFADGSPLKWSWNFGESTSNQVGQTQPAYTYATANTFNVKLTVTNSFGCTDDSIRKFTVYPYPVINAGPDDYVLEGGSIALAATATGNTLSYLWTAIPSPTYLSSNIVLNPVSTPQVDVTYKLTVTAQGNCAKEDYVFIKVLRFPEIPNTFTPNNDGVHDFWEIKYLFTYPGNRVQVFTRTGQLVFESRGYTKPWDGNMNGKALPFDTYYYIIEPGNGRKPVTGYVTIVK
ncbi:MAG: gliding motility-associated C-terminal domain-containing protein, partial [Ferruginibacter sp.]|nr:gliding motility-associated C-terminal domain-containing protein [Ferruginibacter sp.]